MRLLVFVAMIFLVSCSSSEALLGLLDILDSLTLVMTGGGNFDRKVYSELTDAMANFDPLMLVSQNAGWREIVRYYDTNGGPRDVWGDFQSK